MKAFRETGVRLLLACMLLTVSSPALAADPDPSLGSRHDLQARASEIDPRAKEYPELGFIFADQEGNAKDLQHAVVDTSVPSRGQLVVWLMGHNQRFFEHLASYGLHAIQPHYANGWFSKIDGVKRDDGTTLGQVRLEAATGEDHSPLVSIAKPDGLAARSVQFVQWLAEKDPQGNWAQFLTDDHSDLQWDKVILSGISHGSTTAARFAKHQKVARVVMFSGPRDQFETWQGFPSATPPNRFFGFTHVLDSGWVGDHYCRSWQLLGLADFGPLVNVEETSPPYGHSRRLITNCDVDNDSDRAHSVVLSGAAWDEVWRYLFTHPVDQTGDPVPFDQDCTMDLRSK
jgi:hypothetical protein